MKAAYNLCFHPLAGYDGPKLWGAFRFPFLFRLITGVLPFRIKDFHDQYGDVVRLGPDELSFTNPAAWAQIYGIRNGSGIYERPKAWQGKFPLSKAENLITANEYHHNRMRRILKPAFMNEALQEQEPLIQSYIDRLTIKLQEKIGIGGGLVELDIVQWYSFTTFDIIGDLSFGESFECLEKNRLHPWIGISLQFRAALFEVALKHYPWFRLLVQILTPRSLMKSLDVLLKTTREKLDRRLRNSDDRTDFLTHVIRQNEKEGDLRLTPEEIELNMMLIAVAGSDTLTTSLSGATNYLLRHPESYTRLVHEIRSTFSNQQQMTADKLTKLPYLSAVIQETLRMCPPSADGARRCVPSGGDIICGRRVPERARRHFPGQSGWLTADPMCSIQTIVSVNPWASFQSSLNFTKPASFIPERWLPNSGYDSDNKAALQPFLLGNRTCLGQKLAWLELRLVLANLLWNFDLAVPSCGIPSWNSQKIFFNWEKLPMIIRLTTAIVSNHR